MKEQFARTQIIYGASSMEKLYAAKVAVFGVGGVGGYVAEALARSGIGHLLLVDNDKVSVTNINRQIIALHSTIGKSKVKVMKERCQDINPDIIIEEKESFFLPENSDSFDFTGYSYIVDAVDTVSAKIEIIRKAKEAGIPVISSMGAGNKTDPTKFTVADISKTSVCPLARVMRRELKSRGIKNVKVVYSTEIPVVTEKGTEMKGGGMAPGSTAFAPSIAGLLIAATVVNDLARLKND
ncbi:tRNA threonylcarbamoyladenosine dehydratase [Treponema sp.]|uniref:tRNA threonylcarbamoyladenosine dehydratase n=1 Tax=Treponema sp. TaxID=166 RepID=UPI00298D65A4|nr:tRNA threonylcarbamoyladenosine dehydratase [Treponema sp.]MCQ2241768.1 tRNA threonylcarbamoyladenosine dehydratase [Treponema sp.]